jgi:hypothetical protein
VTLAVNDTIVNIDREAPFSLGFYPGLAGQTGPSVQITAIAYDGLGRRALTTPITVTVAE